MAERDIVIPIDTRPKPGWPCPKCHGFGHMCDGGGSYGPTEIRITRPTKCHLCDGTGRVHCTPARPNEGDHTKEGP